MAASLPSAERILVHAPRRTLRLANGLAEFVREHLAETGPRTLVVENIDRADPTDLELLAVLRRRVPAGAADRGDPRGGRGRGIAAEESLGEEEHDALADELEREGTIGARLGAIPYHRERGGDPSKAVEAFLFAVQWCLDAGCHDAVVDLGRRALRLADPEATPRAGGGSCTAPRPRWPRWAGRTRPQPCSTWPGGRASPPPCTPRPPMPPRC